MMFVRMDGFDDLVLRLLSKVKIPAQLQIHPEIRRVTKEFRQAQSTARGNPPPPIDQVIDTLIGYMESVCEFTLGYAHRGKATLPTACHRDE